MLLLGWSLVSAVVLFATSLSPLGLRNTVGVVFLFSCVCVLVSWLEVRFDIFMLARTSETRVAILMGVTYGLLGAGLFAAFGAAFTFSSTVASICAIVGSAVGFGIAYGYALRHPRSPGSSDTL